MAIMSAAKLSDGLSQFYGTENYYQFNTLNRRIVLTDGAQFLAENAGAFWLMDIIASYQREPKFKDQDFQVWTLTVRDHVGTVVATDGNDHKLATQVIEYTDFPLPYIKLFLEDNGELAVILLPSEH